MTTAGTNTNSNDGQHTGQQQRRREKAPSSFRLLLTYGFYVCVAIGFAQLEHGIRWTKYVVDSSPTAPPSEDWSSSSRSGGSSRSSSTDETTTRIPTRDGIFRYERSAEQQGYLPMRQYGSGSRHSLAGLRVMDADVLGQLRLVYMHVGKTGGVSLERVLRASCLWKGGNEQRIDCLNDLLKYKSRKTIMRNGNTTQQTRSSELLLSMKTKKTVHVRWMPSPTPSQDVFNGILWTVRNPIHRVVSALDMQRSLAKTNHTTSLEDTKDEKLFWYRVFREVCGFDKAQDVADVLLQARQSASKSSGGDANATTTTNSSSSSTYNNSRTSLVEFPMVRIPEWGSKQPNNSTQLLDCADLARTVIEGSGDKSKSHLYFNYQHYKSILRRKILPHADHFQHDKSNLRRKDFSNAVEGNMTTIVLRTEHLWDDVFQANLWLSRSAAVARYSNRNSTNNTNVITEENIRIQNAADDDSYNEAQWMGRLQALGDYRVTHGSENYTIKSSLSQPQKEVLCCHLASENEIYETLIRQAENLGETQKERTLHYFYQDCGLYWSTVSNFMNHGRFQWEAWKAAGCPTTIQQLSSRSSKTFDDNER